MGVERGHYGGRPGAKPVGEGIRPRPLALLYGPPKVDASARWPLIEAAPRPKAPLDGAIRGAGGGHPKQRFPQGVVEGRSALLASGKRQIIEGVIGQLSRTSSV